MRARNTHMRRMLALTLIATSALAAAACSPPAANTQELVRVPQDATISEAGSRVAPGGIILIDSGTYTETLDVRVDDVTVRGVDRGGVVLDGEFTRANGIVATGARVAIENLTVQNFQQNGVLVTGVTDENGAGVARGPDGYLPEAAPPPVPGYAVQSVTATNNGLYGIYAFNRTGGVIRDSLASGGSDSGIYIGQCESCHALVEGNTLVLNAVGLEFANASGVMVTGNRIEQNRVGVSVLSNYLEAHGPTRGISIVGNVIADNNAAETPEQAGGAFGIGVALGGTVDAVVERNRIEGNSNAGVWVTSSEDFPPMGTKVAGNEWAANGLDAVFSPSVGVAGEGNCFAMPRGTTAIPADLVSAGARVCSAAPGEFAPPPAPPGIPFSRVAVPPQAAGLTGLGEAPRSVPDAIELPSLATVPVPPRDLLTNAATQ